MFKAFDHHYHYFEPSLREGRTDPPSTPVRASHAHATEAPISVDTLLAAMAPGQEICLARRSKDRELEIRVCDGTRKEEVFHARWTDKDGATHEVPMHPVQQLEATAMPRRSGERTASCEPKYLHAPQDVHRCAEPGKLASKVFVAGSLDGQGNLKPTSLGPDDGTLWRPRSTTSDRLPEFRRTVPVPHPSLYCMAGNKSQLLKSFSFQGRIWAGVQAPGVHRLIEPFAGTAAVSIELGARGLLPPGGTLLNELTPYRHIVLDQMARGERSLVEADLLRYAKAIKRLCFETLHAPDGRGSNRPVDDATVDGWAREARFDKAQARLCGAAVRLFLLREAAAHWPEDAASPLNCPANAAIYLLLQDNRFKLGDPVDLRASRDAPAQQHPQTRKAAGMVLAGFTFQMMGTPAELKAGLGCMNVDTAVQEIIANLRSTDTALSGKVEVTRVDGHARAVKARRRDIVFVDWAYLLRQDQQAHDAMPYLPGNLPEYGVRGCLGQIAKLAEPWQFGARIAMTNRWNEDLVRGLVEMGWMVGPPLQSGDMTEVVASNFDWTVSGAPMLDLALGDPSGPLAPGADEPADLSLEDFEDPSRQAQFAVLYRTGSAVAAKAAPAPVFRPAVWMAPRGHGQQEAPVRFDGRLRARLDPQWQQAHPDLSAPLLIEAALGSLADGSARLHKAVSRQVARFEFMLRDSEPPLVMSAVYVHDGRSVLDIALYRDGNEIGCWGQSAADEHDDVTDELLVSLNALELSDEIVTTVTGQRGDEAVETNLSRTFGHDAAMVDISLSGTFANLSAAHGRYADYSSDDDAEEAEQPDEPESVPGDDAVDDGSADETDSKQGNEPAVAPLRRRGALPLTFRARAALISDSAVIELARALHEPATATDPPDTGRQEQRRDDAADGSGDGPPSPFRMPTHLGPFLASVLRGSGQTLPDVHPDVRSYEKAYDRAPSSLPERVQRMECVRQNPAGGTTVTMLAWVRSGRCVQVRPFGEDALTALDEAARHLDAAEDLSLPDPGEINDALLGLFDGDPLAPQLRVAALLQTPRYCIGPTRVGKLQVLDGRIVGEPIHGEPVDGEALGDSTGDDVATDDDWLRIVRPWLQVHPGGDMLLTINFKEASASFEALCRALPGLRALEGAKPRDALQRLAVSVLDSAGVSPRQMCNKRTKVSPVLKLGDVDAMGRVDGVRLSPEGQTIVREWAAFRRRQLRDAPDAKSLSLFTFGATFHVESSIMVHWTAIEAAAQRRTDAPAPRHSGCIRLPRANELNAMIGGMYAAHAHPTLARASVRFRLPPYALTGKQLEDMAVEGGEFVLPLEGRDRHVVAIEGRDGADPDSDWERIFKPHLDLIGDAPFTSGHKRGKVVKVGRHLHSEFLSRLMKEHPEFGFLNNVTPLEGLTSLAACTLLQAGVPEGGLTKAGLLLGDLNNALIERWRLSEDDAYVVTTFKLQMLRSGKNESDAAFHFASPSNLQYAIKTHLDRLTRLRAPDPKQPPLDTEPDALSPSTSSSAPLPRGVSGTRAARS